MATDPNAPPVDPATGLTADQFNSLATAQQNLNDIQSKGADIMTLVRDGMNGIEQAAKNAGVSLDNLSAITQQQTELFGLGTTAVVKAREAFEGFAGVDYSGLSTLTSQMKDIQDALFSGGTAASEAARAVENLSNKYLSAGVKQDIIDKAKRAGADASAMLLSAIKKETDGIITHADNMLRAQTAYVQMAGKTGELGDVMTAAGKNMMNVNDLLEKQQEMLKNTREATGLSATQVEKWYNQLGLVPGALKEVVSIGSKTGETTSMLTAVIQTATGSGREMSDVMKDLNTAFRDYGLVGDKALLFSVRMSDVSTRLRAPIEDVTSALRGSADAFKMFATGQENASSSAESLAKSLNQYGKALESTGLSATAAVEIAGNLNTQVARLNTGQLAFISQRTGGAGGLMGAAQETLKLQTDPGAVVRDAMQTLQQQFGRIVTIQEAATSEAAASQNIKQTAMLQQLLGPLAKDQATANRLLEAMKNQGEGQVNALEDALKPTAVQDTAQKGVDLQSKSYGVLTESRNILEEIRDIGDRGALSMVGKLTAGVTNQDLTLAQGALKTSLSEQMRAAMAAGGTQVAATTAGLTGGSVRATGGADVAADLHRTLTSVQDFVTGLRATFDTLHGAVSPVQSVGSAAQTSAATRPPEGAMNTQGTGATPALIPGTSGPNTMNVVGKITIDCPHCGRPNDASNQFKITTGPAGQAGQ